MKLLPAIVGMLATVFSALSVVADDVQPKTVLVTGASSGIGLRITEVLSANGYLVYAGARKEEDLKRLEAMENVESVRLDVTVQSDIDAAVKLITKKGRGLYGLVNNAGIISMGPLIELPITEIETVFDVNVYGPFRVTQAFAPLIIESKGRIVNISSINGIFAGGFSGPYSMSKHALEAFTVSLASEMERFGVKVSAIEPGTFASNSGKTARKRLEKNAFWSEGTAYKDELKFLTSAKGNGSAADPEVVAKAVTHALFSETPKRRYLVVADAFAAKLTIGKALEEVVQLNQDQAYTLSREQLINILDKQLKSLK